MSTIKGVLQNKTTLTLILIFIAAVILRFLFFPHNIYFGYDQARDAFGSLEILEGEFKIVGPTTSIPGLNHGALFYYLYALIYFISQSDPAGLAVFLRIYNALGVFLIFLIGKNLFSQPDSSSGKPGSISGKWMGILCALFFAFSYEQTQYALFMTHPALAVITVLTFYLGLVLLVFKNKPYGLIISALGLGLSFQFHFLLIFLFIVFMLNFLIFRRRIPRLNFKTISLALLAFFLSISTFVIAEVRFGFKTFNNLLGLFSQPSQETVLPTQGGVNNALLAASRYINDNFLAINGIEPFVLLILLVSALYFLRRNESRDKIIFLFIWFLVGLISYFINDTSLYFYGIGTSLSLLIFAAFLIMSIFSKSRIASVVLILIILSSNLYLIYQNNPKGPNKEINVQTGMLLEDQKKAIDYIYSKSAGDPFAVNAFSMPLNINTTWAYLFQWYGQKEYGYLPVWGGKSAIGFEGNLEINNSRSTLPVKRFLITEPIRGLENEVRSFMTDESWFTDIIEEKRFGEIIVDFQKPK